MNKLACGVILTIVLLAGVVGITLATTGQEFNNQTTQGPNSKADQAIDAYDFPVKPGTAKWRKFKTHDQMITATQIPQEVLVGMSTRGLVQTVLNYPLSGDLLAYNGLQSGFNNMAASFNGLLELLIRGNAGEELLAHYKTMNPAAVDETWSLERQGEHEMGFTYIETLLAQDSILASFSDSARQDLLNSLIEKVERKQERSDIFGRFGLERTALVIGRALQQENRFSLSWKVANSLSLREFLREGINANDDVLNDILSEVNVQLRGEYTSADFHIQDYGSYIYTPKGTRVSAQLRTFELTPTQIASNNNYVATNYPRATRETNASRKYNCHSYAWYNQSTSNNIWLNSPGDDKYWQDGSYVGSYNVGAAGRKVSYSGVDHSAITASITQFRSKWGQLPRMLHVPSYCPYNASRLYYYQRGT